MDATLAIINSRALMDELSGLADKPTHALLSFGLSFVESDVQKNPATQFWLYHISPDIGQWGPTNPYEQKMRAVVTQADYILDANGQPIKYSDANSWAIYPTADLAARVSKVLIDRFRELPRAVGRQYLDNAWKEIPNWAWNRIEAAYVANNKSRDDYNASFRIYLHEIVVRLRRAGIRIVGNTAKWADPLFDEITLEHTRPDQGGGIDAATALGLFVKQQEYVPGSIGTFWYAPTTWNAPSLARRGEWK